MRPGRTVRSGGSWRPRRPSILDPPCTQRGGGAPFPKGPCPSCSGREVGVAFRGGGRESRPLASQRVAVRPSQASPTPPRPLGSGGGERGAGRERVDTHRPKLPVWASCRMRCSCLFIILGAGWGLRGHGGGRGPGSPRPSLPAPAAPLSPRMGGRRSPLPGPAALRRPLAPSSSARDSAPGPQVTPLSKFVFSLAPGFRAPRRPPAGARDGRAGGRLAVHRLCGSPAPGPAPPHPGGGKQVSRVLPPRGRTLGSAPPAGPWALGFKNSCTPLKGKEGSMLGTQRPRTGPSSPYWPIWACQRMLPWTPSPKDLLATLS